MAKASSDFDAKTREQQIAAAYHEADRVKFAYLPLYYEDVIAGISKQIAYTSRQDEQIFAWQMTRRK